MTIHSSLVDSAAPAQVHQGVSATASLLLDQHGNASIRAAVPQVRCLGSSALALLTSSMRRLQDARRLSGKLGASALQQPDGDSTRVTCLECLLAAQKAKFSVAF